MAKAAVKVVEEAVEDDDDMPSIVEYSIDLNEQEAPVPLPEREYPATIVRATRKASAAGNQYVEVLFSISADDYPADYEEGSPEGTVIAYRRVPLEDHPTARYRMKKFLEAIGAPISRRLNLDDWLHLTAAVDVRHETYEGEKRATIAKVRAA